VVDAMERQLLHEPERETRNRKRMKPDRPGFVAPWELRVGDLRVYYDVEAASSIVWIVAVGAKARERVRVRGRDYGR
jgi:mRNA-degrading endonuclease RelE of RelBE toxin-antitoxin system